MNHRLTQCQRGAIKPLLDEERSQKHIAEYLGVYPSLICYELKRCSMGHYDPEMTQTDYEQKYVKRGRFTPEKQELI